MIWVILACIASAIFYRAGGQSTDDNAQPKWIPKWLRKSWVRDWLCPACLLLVLSSYLQLSSSLSLVMLVLYYGLSGAALSTYWDWMFGGKDNFYVHGLGCGLAGIPLLWVGVPLWIILTRIVICTIGMGLWSKFTGSDVKEEFGRGILFIL